MNAAYSMETLNSQDDRNLLWKFPCC